MAIGDVPFRPVRLFSVLVEQNEPMLILLRSFFLDLLEVAERLVPVHHPRGAGGRAPPDAMDGPHDRRLSSRPLQLPVTECRRRG